MTKTVEVKVLPIFMEEMQKVIIQKGNTKQLFHTFIRSFTKNYMNKYQWTQEEALHQAIETVVHAYIEMELEIPA